MDMENISWQAFRKTGDIDAYLLHTACRENEKRRDNEWKAVKYEDSLYAGRTTAKQTVF